MPAATKTANAADPIARRAELHEQLSRAQERGDEYTLTIRNGSQALDAAQHQLAEAYIGEVRGEATGDDIAELRAAIEQHEREVAEARKGADVVNTATARIKAEVERLHRVERDAFIADAQQLADEAADALEALREPYHRAYDAWSRAQSRWAQFTGDLEDVGSAPTWPWPSPLELFEATASERRTGRKVARLPIPAQLSPAPQGPEPEAPGTLHLWERADGYRLSTTVGSDGDVVFDADPDWRLIEARPPREA
jgi:hypothetical protein